MNEQIFGVETRGYPHCQRNTITPRHVLQGVYKKFQEYAGLGRIQDSQDP